MFISCYATLGLVKIPGARFCTSIELRGVYLCGGAVESKAEAEQLARDTVNLAGGHRRGTVLPRTFEYETGFEPDGTPHLLLAFYEAQTWFESLVARMNEASDAITHTALHCR